MVQILSLAERSTYRSTIQGLTDLERRLEQSLKRGQTIPLKAQTHLRHRYQTSESSRWLEAVSNELGTTTETYLSLLKGMAPNSLSAFVEFMTPEEAPARHHEFFCDKLEAIERRDLLRATFSCPPGHAKSLDVNLPILTTAGWKTIGTLDVGDYVYGTDGKPTRVLAKSEVFNKPCYRATTSDGETVIVSADHRWTLRRRRGYGFVTDTTQAFVDWKAAQKDCRSFLLPSITPLAGEDAGLPLDPYLLGVWLGDGSTDAARITSSDEDRSTFAKVFERAGYTVSHLPTPHIAFDVLGLRTPLRTLKVLGNKHIPAAYMRASPAQRLALLQGLMDTDGNCRDNGGCRFSNTDERLIDATRELLWSLGIPNTKVLMRLDQSYWHDGYTRRQCWQINFSGVDCFRLERKLARLKACKRRYGRYIDFEPCETVPTQCIAVDAFDELFLVGRSFIPTHNTKFCSRYYPAWYLGRNRNHRYLQGGHSQNFAENEFGKYVRDILADPRFQEVFPDVMLHPRSTAAGSWRINRTRSGGYVAKGVGQSIAGYRGHCGGIDDPFGTREDAQSEAIRNKVGAWLFTDFQTRLLPGAPMFIIATRWHQDDLIGRVEIMSKQGKGIPWEIFNLPAIIETEEELATDPLGRDMGEVLWPEFYNEKEILNFKATLPGADWHALYKGRPRDEEGNVVKVGWFRRYKRLPAPYFPGTNSNPDGDTGSSLRRVTVSVDCANKDTVRANPTVIGVWYEDHSRKHYLAEVVRKKMEFNTLVRTIESVAAAHNATAILVEDAGAGSQYLQQRAGLAPAPLIPRPTGNKSKEFRFDGVTPMIEAGEVFLPQQAIWLPDYEAELLAFPNGTTDDQVDMTSQYLAWARAGRRFGTRKMKTGQRGGH